MVKRVANFTRNGVTDWLLQRLSAVVLAVYFVALLIYFLSGSHTGFQSWQSFILSGWMRVFTVVAFAGFVVHAWVGLWTVATDYIKNCFLRFAFHAFYGILLLGMFVWCMDVLWS